eukprot:7995147-Alexandrium_andersonii.AAC.1
MHTAVAAHVRGAASTQHALPTAGTRGGASERLRGDVGRHPVLTVGVRWGSRAAGGTSLSLGGLEQEQLALR